MNDKQPILLGFWEGKRWKQARAVFGREGLSPTLTAQMGGKHQNNFVHITEKEDDMKLRIRKLTEGECMRLMGFEKKDTDAMRQAGLSRANIYHTAGDGLVTTIIAGLVGSLLGIDYKKDIEEYVDKLHNEVV